MAIEKKVCMPGTRSCPGPGPRAAWTRFLRDIAAKHRTRGAELREDASTGQTWWLSHLRCRPCINCISCRLQIILVIWAEISSIAALDTAGPGAASPRPHAAINCIFISALNLAPARPLPSHYTLGRAKMQIFQYQAGFCSSSAATCPLCLHHPSVLVWLCEVATHRPRHHTTATWQGWRIELPTKVHEDFIITKKAFSY